MLDKVFAAKYKEWLKTAPAKERDADVLRTFADRLRDEWLPAYCSDPKRGYDPAGFKATSNKVSPEDAADFMWAIDQKVVQDSGGGRYRLPKSGASVVIFWEGRKTKSPRSITLSMEPIITIASIARLHRDHGWPVSCLGMEAAKWEFDFAAFCPDATTEYLAGEVKKSVVELDSMLEGLRSLCRAHGQDSTVAPKASSNAHKKWLGLCRSQAPLFWAVGPSKAGRLFEVSYNAGVPVLLTEASPERLAFPTAV